jgi:predicted GNAT superfamily acetyltransferase
VRIPADFAALLDGDLESARGWRMSARRAFLHYFPLGYRVVAFVTTGDVGAAYILTRSA